jgi:hypothetical protein
MKDREAVVEHFRWQADWCRRLGSPLYGRLLDRAAEDFDLVWPVLAEQPPDMLDSFIALRFMGAVHRLVLEGRAPGLAAFYPSAGGDPRGGDPWAAFADTVHAHSSDLIRLTQDPVQTNEVGRSAALVGGFLTVAKRTGLPLRLLEIGTSAGLNLRWDHFRYESRGQTWGHPESRVRLCDFNSERRLPFEVPAEVSDRAGCDAAPVDPTTDDGFITLVAYVWPDQAGRLRRLRAAVEIARRVPAQISKADAPEWLSASLEQPTHGEATVIFHSIVWPYLNDESRASITATIEGAGRRAGEEAPIAWLRMEADGDEASIRLRMWPDGSDREVARSGYHGAYVRWLG